MSQSWRRTKRSAWILAETKSASSSCRQSHVDLGYLQPAVVDKSSVWNLLLELLALFRVHGVEHVFAQPLSQLIAVVQQKGFQLNGCCCGFLRELEIGAAIGPKVGDSKVPQGTLVNDVKLRLLG